MNNETVSFERAKAILARAALLEARSPATISLDAVREIGREAGIDARAIENAIAEDAQQAPATMRHRFRGLGTSLLAGAAVAVGSAYALQGSFLFLSVLAGVGGVMMASGIAAGLARGASAHRQFQLNNAALWGGYLVLRIQANGHDNAYLVTDLIQVVAVASIATAVTGSVLVAIKERGLSRRESSEGADGPRKGLRAAGAQLISAAKGIWEHLQTPLWRTASPA
jgi:hypothetical protein